MTQGKCKLCPYNVKSRKTNSQNAYMWELIGKISDKLGISKEDIYRHHIRYLGVYTQVIIDAGAYDEFNTYWSKHGIGWFCDIVDELEYADYKKQYIVYTYYGTSTYNTKQMKQVLDSIIEEAKDLGIDTTTYEEQSLLKGA